MPALSHVNVLAPRLFDFDWCLRFLEPRCVPGVEAVVGGVAYVRSLRLDGVACTLKVERRAGALHVLATRGVPAPVLRRLVRLLFDLDADVAAFRRMASRDHVLRRRVARWHDVRVPQFADPFEGAIRAVLGQQISVRGASTTAGRLVGLLGERAPGLDGHAPSLFPTPAAIAGAGPERLAGIGLTRARARAVHAVAEATLDGRLPWNELPSRPSADAHRALVAVTGIGPWTASYIQMRALGDRDACPLGDLGLLKALRAAHPRTTLTPARVAHLTARWSPWRAYGTLCLWMAGNGGRD